MEAIGIEKVGKRSRGERSPITRKSADQTRVHLSHNPQQFYRSHARFPFVHLRHDPYILCYQTIVAILPFESKQSLFFSLSLPLSLFLSPSSLSHFYT